MTDDYRPHRGSDSRRGARRGEQRPASRNDSRSSSRSNARSHSRSDSRSGSRPDVRSSSGSDSRARSNRSSRSASQDRARARTHRSSQDAAKRSKRKSIANEAARTNTRSSRAELEQRTNNRISAMNMQNEQVKKAAARAGLDGSYEKKSHASRSGSSVAGMRSAASQAKERAEHNVGDYDTSRYSARKKRMSTGKKVAIGVLCAFAVLIVGCGIAGAMWYNNIANNIKGDENITNLTTPAANEPYYVLLMGSDSRDGYDWETPDENNEGDRADSIMVARVDEKNQKVSIISVPRDLRVNFGSKGYHKINSAIDFGGYDELISKLNEILGIKINYYATVQFMGFIDMVDTLGGINVEVPEGTATQGGEYILTPGDDVLIDGSDALVLARCRHGWPQDQGVYAMGDYQRTLNQRNIIKAIAKKVLQQDITKLPALIETLSKSIETNMGVDKIITLAQVMKGMDVEGIESAQLPIGASTIDGAWAALMYQDVYDRMLKNFKSGDPLFEGLDNFDTESNDDDVHGNYIDGPDYAYTTYSARYGNPYSDGYQPSAFTQEAIERTRAGVSQ